MALRQLGSTHVHVLRFVEPGIDAPVLSPLEDAMLR